MKALLSRRRMLVFAGGSLLLGLLLKFGGWRWGRRLFRPHWDLSTQQNQFFRVSALLLEVPTDELDRDLALEIWNEFLNDHEAVDNLMDLVAVIDQAPREASSKLKLQKLTKFWTEENQEFASSILSVWYTGTIKIKDGPPKRLFYEQSCMFSYYTHLRPPPGTCAGAFGYWATPPKLKGAENG